MPGPGDQPVDQRTDDAGSLVFETAPLEADLEIAGDASLLLAVESDRPVAQVTARLVDVHPDGQATRVCYGPFNLTHRDGHEHPEPLEPGRRYTVRVPMKHVAQRFAKGHRIRLSISSVYFPISWPTPEPATLTVFPAETQLELPVRTSSPLDETLHPFADAVLGPPLRTEVIEEGEATWHAVMDHGTGAAEVRVVEDDGRYRLAYNDLTIASRGEERYGFSGNDYAHPLRRNEVELRAPARRLERQDHHVDPHDRHARGVPHRGPPQRLGGRGAGARGELVGGHPAAAGLIAHGAFAT